MLKNLKKRSETKLAQLNHKNSNLESLRTMSKLNVSVLFLLIQFLIVSSTFAQDNSLVEISGQVTDRQKNEPLSSMPQGAAPSARGVSAIPFREKSLPRRIARPRAWSD